MGESYGAIGKGMVGHKGKMIGMIGYPLFAMARYGYSVIRSYSRYIVWEDNRLEWKIYGGFPKWGYP